MGDPLFEEITSKSFEGSGDCSISSFSGLSFCSKTLRLTAGDLFVGTLEYSFTAYFCQLKVNDRDNVADLVEEVKDRRMENLC